MKIKQIASYFLAFIVSFTIGSGPNMACAVDVNLDVNNVKMMFVDSSGSKSPTLSNTENCVFYDDNTSCDVVGRVGSSYYIIFGESTDSKKLVGNRDNTYQGSDNLKSHYQVKVKIEKKKNIPGMDAQAHYVLGLNNVKNGVWGVTLDYPTENVSITSEQEYIVSVNLKDLQNSTSNDYIIKMKLMPPEEINKSAVAMCNNNTLEIKYANSAKLTSAGLSKMRSTKRRDYTINFPNGVFVYIPRVVTQKTDCVLGGGFDTCPDMEDRARKSADSMFFATVAGTMSDSCRISYPLDEAFGEDQDGLKKWKEGQTVYAYPVNLVELAKKTKLSDKSNLIDFSREIETTVKDGTVTLSLINGAIDVKNEIYIVTLNSLSSSEFPTSKTVTVAKAKNTSTTTAKKATSSTTKK